MIVKATLYAFLSESQELQSIDMNFYIERIFKKADKKQIVLKKIRMFRK